MAQKRSELASDPATGFGTNGHQSGARFYRKDGKLNIVRKGVRFMDKLSWYHTMLSMPRWEFWLTLCSIYMIINLVFASVYYLIGIEHLGGIQTASATKNFSEAFFFSAQTFTTVGYGRVSPIGFITSCVATLEAFMGLLGFALASGLFYGRFSMPRPFLYFSQNALIAPYKKGKALMFRTVPYKNNHLTDAEVKLTVVMRSSESGIEKNLFYPLAVEFGKINSLALNWTVVHPITEESPLFGLGISEMKAAKIELLVFIKAFDEIFANSVVARTSYNSDEIIEGARFRPMYHSSEDGTATILNVDKLDEIEMTDGSIVNLEK